MYPPSSKLIHNESYVVSNDPWKIHGQIDKSLRCSSLICLILISLHASNTSKMAPTRTTAELAILSTIIKFTKGIRRSSAPLLKSLIVPDGSVTRAHAYPSGPITFSLSHLILIHQLQGEYRSEIRPGWGGYFCWWRFGGILDKMDEFCGWGEKLWGENCFCACEDERNWCWEGEWKY